MKKYARSLLYILLLTFSFQLYFAAAADVTVNSANPVNSIRTTYRPSFKGGTCWQSMFWIGGDTYYFSFEALGFNASRIGYNCGWYQVIGKWYGDLGIRIDGHDIGDCKMQFGETVSKPLPERKDRVVIFQCPREIAGDTVPEYVRNIPPDKIAGSPKEAKDRFKLFCPKESGDAPTNCDIVKLCGAPREVIEGLKCNAQRCVNQRDDKGDGNFTCRCAQGLIVIKDAENKPVCMPNSCGGGARPNDSNQCTCYKSGTNTIDDERVYDYGSSSCQVKPKTKEECEKIQAVWHQGDENAGQSSRCEICGERMQANREKNICEPIGSCPVVPECNQQTQIIQDCKCVPKPAAAPTPSACSGSNNTPGQNQIIQGNTCFTCPSDQKPNSEKNDCVPKQSFTPNPQVPEPAPASCRGQQGTAGDGQIRVGGQCSDCQGNSVPNAAKDACVPGTPTPRPGNSCLTEDTREQGVVAQDGRTCTPVRQCFNCTDPNKHCVEGRCVPKTQTCPQGQILQNTQCVPQQQQCQQGQVLQNGQCVPQQQQCRQDEEMIQGRCFPKKPNPQQPKEQPKQQQQQGPTPQQQQQMQQLQAMQECQMRQPQGAWQWNGFQCLPNPNYNPQGYGAQPSVGGGVVCNFFGSDAIEVPAGEQFSVTYDVTGAKREIKVDTSPKSTTKYDRQAPTTQANTNTVLNQFGYPQNGTGAAVQTSQQGQATITAPKKKGKLKVSLIVDAVRQNSEACKPIQVTIVDAAPQQSSYDSGNTSNYDSGSQYASNTQPQDTGPTIETPSEIIAQNRRVVSSQPAQKAPEDDDAYAYLCKTLGIGCAKDAPQVDTGPSIRDLQVGNGTQQQGTTREITIDPNAEDPADLPNIGELPGEGGENTRNGQQLATDVGIDGDNKKAYSTVLNYLGENGQYAEPIGPNSDTSGVLNSTDAEAPAQTGERVGIFTRMWRWFLNLLGFGPEYVAA